MALTNTSSAAERYSADAVAPTGRTLVAAGTIAPGVSLFIPGSHLSNVAPDQIVVRADGTMAVSEDVGPTGGIGVVTMPGIPLAAAISV